MLSNRQILIMFYAEISSLKSTGNDPLKWSNKRINNYWNDYLKKLYKLNLISRTKYIKNIIT